MPLHSSIQNTQHLVMALSKPSAIRKPRRKWQIGLEVPAIRRLSERQQSYGPTFYLRGAPARIELSLATGVYCSGLFKVTKSLSRGEEGRRNRNAAARPFHLSMGGHMLALGRGRHADTSS